MGLSPRKPGRDSLIRGHLTCPPDGVHSTPYPGICHCPRSRVRDNSSVLPHRSCNLSMTTRTATPDLGLPLAQPITLTGGPRSHLVTLMDAAILIRDLEPFRQARPVWDRAAEMILVAATTRKRDDIAEATRQLLVCVERENWWKPTRAKELIE
jgi:hypothetical protein